MALSPSMIGFQYPFVGIRFFADRLSLTGAFCPKKALAFVLRLSYILLPVIYKGGSADEDSNPYYHGLSNNSFF